MVIERKELFRIVFFSLLLKKKIAMTMHKLCKRNRMTTPRRSSTLN